MTKAFVKTIPFAIGFLIAGLIAHVLGIGDWWTVVAMTAGAFTVNATRDDSSTS